MSFRIMLGGLFVLSGYFLVSSFNTAQELDFRIATCQDSMELLEYRQAALLSEGRFILKKDKDGRMSYHFVAPEKTKKGLVICE